VCALSIKEEVEELKHIDKSASLKSLCENYDGLSTICHSKEQKKNRLNCSDGDEQISARKAKYVLVGKVN